MTRYNQGNTESGRSMVEMLGRLAIVSILSVGSIAGYKAAVHKIEVNTILDEIRKRATIAMQQLMNGARTINLTEFHSDTQKDKIRNTYTVTATQNGSFFTLTLNDIPQNICDKIVANKPSQASGVYVNSPEKTECTSETNTVSFLFTTTSEKQNFTSIRTQEQELNLMPSIQTEQRSIPNPKLPPCNDQDIACKCHQSGGFIDWLGNCISCTSKYETFTTRSECASCQNTSTTRLYTDIGKCILPCQEGEFANTLGTCYSCSRPVGIFTTDSECSKCDNTPNKRFQDKSRGCFPCTYTLSVITDPNECKKCSSRKMSGSFCVKK